MATLPDRVFLDGSFFLSVLWMFYAISVLTAIFLLRKLLIFLWEFPYITDCFSLAGFKILSFVFNFDIFSSVQFSHSVMSDSLWSHGLQHARLPCPSPKLMSTQTHVHSVSHAIQPSHPLSSPSFPSNLSQHQGLFKWVSSLHQLAKVLEFQLQHQSFQWTPRTDLL